MCERRNKVILLRQTCVSLSQGLQHSMDLTSSQHNHLQNRWVRKFERQEGKMFLISLCFLVTLKNIINYKEKNVFLTLSYLLINFFSEELYLWHLYTKCNRQLCCGVLAMHVVFQVCCTCILLSWQFPGICPPVICLCLVPRNEAVTIIKLFREVCLQAVSQEKQLLQA